MSNFTLLHVLRSFKRKRNKTKYQKQIILELKALSVYTQNTLAEEFPHHRGKVLGFR